ncbi:MAG: hypothetical protein QG557_1215, partial [Pseudomonadota bacterium]|nr:hypothetical protein [Pseudomonadota bacterium]
MTHQTKRLFFTIAGLLSVSTSVFALEKPKTMDEMWKIIEMQQKQIETLQKNAMTVPPVTQKITDNTLSATNPSTPATAAINDVKKLEHKTDVLSQEVEKLRTNLSIPEEAKYKSMYGMGPAASKVYQVGQGLSIGGYGEASYRNIVGDKGALKDSADMYRMILYTGYKFTDKIIFNSELEIEHGTTARNGGTVSVEFAALDFFIDPMANVRAGMVLTPMGFINQIHEP